MDVPMQQMLETAKCLAKEGKDWHFHLLTRACAFNKAKGRFAIILETGNGSEPARCLFDKKPLAHSLALAKLLYGNDFLDEGPEVSSHSFAALLERAKALSAQKKRWHHHHFPPGCVLSSSKEMHILVLEDEAKGEKMEVECQSKPEAALSELERMLYKKV